MSQGPSLAGRAALAVVLTIGFYAMALGIAFGLLWLVYAQVAYAERISVKLTFFAVVAAGAILWSVLPRWDRFEAPGPKLDKRAQPRLFRAIEEIARKTGQAPPAEVYMVSDVNAFVAQRGGIMGFGSKRIMGLGLPLMQVLTRREFEAVLAHEFGHFHGGDTRLGPFIYKTRFAIERTIQNLAGAGSMLHLPFLWYGKMFLRLTLAVSRAQEYAADALAARTVGAAALAGGLKKLPGASIAFGPYFDQEMVPALEAGVRPPLSGGFARFIESDGIAPVMEKVTNEALTSDEDDPYDTHPRLPARLAALEGQPEGTPCDGSPAIALLDDLPTVERALLREFARNPSLIDKLEDISWEDAGARVIVPSWTESVQRGASWLKGRTAADIPRDAAGYEAIARGVLDAEVLGRVSAADLAGWAQGMCGRALCLLLAARGFHIESLPGSPVLCVKGDQRIDVFSWLKGREAGELSEEGYRARLADVGLTDADLGEVVTG
jgi:Zn-dependent protease with chaperone function